MKLSLLALAYRPWRKQPCLQATQQANTPESRPQSPHSVAATAAALTPPGGPYSPGVRRPAPALTLGALAKHYPDSVAAMAVGDDACQGAMAVGNLLRQLQRPVPSPEAFYWVSLLMHPGEPSDSLVSAPPLGVVCELVAFEDFFQLGGAISQRAVEAALARAPAKERSQLAVTLAKSLAELRAVASWDRVHDICLRYDATGVLLWNALVEGDKAAVGRWLAQPTPCADPSHNVLEVLDACVRHGAAQKNRKPLLHDLWEQVRTHLSRDDFRSAYNRLIDTAPLKTIEWVVDAYATGLFARDKALTPKELLDEVTHTRWPGPVCRAAHIGRADVVQFLTVKAKRHNISVLYFPAMLAAAGGHVEVLDYLQKYDRRRRTPRNTFLEDWWTFALPFSGLSDNVEAIAWLERESRRRESARGRIKGNLACAKIYGYAQGAVAQWIDAKLAEPIYDSVDSWAVALPYHELMSSLQTARTRHRVTGDVL